MTTSAKNERPKPAARQPEPHAVAHTLLIAAANKSSRGASRALLRAFGIGLVEWRVLRMLALDGQSAATRLCVELDLDKAAVSRSLSTLEQLGCISRAPDARDARTRRLGLTPGGSALYRRIVKVADARERGLFAGFSPEEIATLTGLLDRLHRNAVEMNREDEAPQAGAPRRR